jgi:hypothetical protein
MKTNITDYMLNTYTMMSEQEIILSYMGDINPGSTDTLLRSVKNDHVSFEEEPISKKKVYNVIVECLENICRHTGMIKDKQHPGIFLLGKDEKAYYILTGNYIFTEEIEGIKKTLDEINHLEKDNIKKKYRETLLEGNISDKGGAGLGIIDIALKSGNKLEYQFISATEAVSFYILKVQVPRVLENSLA